MKKLQFVISENLQVGQAESWVPRLHGQTKETTFLGLFF